MPAPPSYRLAACPAKLPGCLGTMRKEATQCANCLAFSRKHQLSKKEKDRLVLEDRIVDGVTRYLQETPTHVHRLAPAEVKKRHSTAHEMMLLLSDVHFSEVVDPRVAMGLSYNEDIAKHRLERVRDVVIRYKHLRETSYPIQKLTVAVLGDMLSGDIHEELEINNQNPLPVALVTLAYYLHDMGLSLAKEFGDVEFVFVPGNHPRTTKKMRFKQRTTTNWEYVLGHFVKALAGTSYHVSIPLSIVAIHRVFNWRVGLHHGDSIKSNSFAGIPFYGMRQRREAVQALLRHLGQPAVDFLAFGHFHSPTILEGTDSTIIINGSVKGGDEYSIGNYFGSNDPVQLLLTFHEKHGLTDYSRINLKGVQ